MNRPSRYVGAVIAFGPVLVTSFCLAGMPQPYVVYYGQAKDCYGWPYTKNATVVLLRGTNEVTRYTINKSLAPGVNFVLQVPIEDGRDPNRYVPNALRPGEAVSIVVRDPYGDKTIMEKNTVPPVTRPGDFIAINVTAGTDEDKDELPDEWEEELIYWGWLLGLSPTYTSIWEVVGSQDYDGDGQSNADEYHAGTFAFLDYDFFGIQNAVMTTNEFMRLDFFTVRGKTYTAQCCTNLLSNGWSDCAYALTPSGPLSRGWVEGDGGWLSFFVPFKNFQAFYRARVK